MYVRQGSRFPAEGMSIIANQANHCRTFAATFFFESSKTLCGLSEKRRFVFRSLYALVVVVFSFCFFTPVEATEIGPPWAQELVAYNAIDPVPGFNNPFHVLGPPVGGTVSTPSNVKVHSLGRPGPSPGSYILVKFITPIEDHRDHPMGLDFIVYGNAFWVGGNPNRKWVEPAIVEISEDINADGVANDPWYIIPGSRGYGRHVLPEGIPNPSPPLAGNVSNPTTDGREYDWGYTELTPTLQEYLDNYMRPDDPFTVGLTPRSGGGDAFDIRWAVPVDASGNPEGIRRFHFVRISSFINGSSATGSFTPEIGGIAAVARDSDSDGDGILDDYEIRVAHTDPHRPESTVLALEIPQEYGGSPAGTFLGVAHDAMGNAIAFFSAGARRGVRRYNCIVDIVQAPDPAPGIAIPERVKSSAICNFYSSEADFVGAGIQEAEITMAYTSDAIVGLDEAGLEPFRLEGRTYDQGGISSITKDLEANRVTFRSRYPGTFILASTPGSGDTPGGNERIQLHATPSQVTAGIPGELINLTSGIIRESPSTVVPDGTLFTISSTLGRIVTPDADFTTPGMQVSSTEGIIVFDVAGGSVAGTSSVLAVSHEGTLFGSTTFTVAPARASGPVRIYTVHPRPTAPGPIVFMTDPIFDSYGNRLSDEHTITLSVAGGKIIGADARPDQPGHQVCLVMGTATFSVRIKPSTKGESALVYIYVYADPEETELIGSEFFLVDVVPMPHATIVSLVLLVLCLGVIGFYRLARDRRCAV